VPDSGRGLQMKDREGGQHMEAIILDHVCKTFSCGKRAVDSVSLSLEEGEVFGFLGPNGAGKTTTVKLLNGMLMPTEGTCKVFDMDPAGQFSA